MLETILKIGELLRQGDDDEPPHSKIKHHRYFIPAPKSDEKNKRVVKRIAVPVNEDFSFNFEKASPINEDDDALYFFRFKTSEQDSSPPRYVIGDIYYARKEDKSECGMYRTSDETKNKSKSSFDFDKDDLRPFLRSDWIVKFRESFKRQMKDIEAFLAREIEALEVTESTKERGIFLHFDFNGKHWYELEGFEYVIQGIVETFFEGEAQKLTLKKSLYNAISSNQEKADVQFPNFNRNEQFKTRAFTSHEANNLIYAIRYIGNPTLRIKSLHLVVLPQGDKLTRKDLEAFASRKNLDDEAQAERTLARKNAPDRLLRAVTDDVPPSVTQFDLVFKDTGGKVAIDAVEISGIEKTFLSELSERVKQCRNDVIDQRSEQFAEAEVPDDFKGIGIEESFRHILDGTVFEWKSNGDAHVPQPKKLRNESRFQSHLFRVLPQIYAGAYTHDALLLPALVENTEYKIRNGKTNREARDYFNFARFDYFFLTKLQVNGEQTMNELKTSPSYEAGKLLGELARPINFKIGSFSKTHAGMLTRRIADVKSLVALINEISEIMNRHDLATNARRKISSDLMSNVREMTDKDYRKDFFAFGFFESYFKSKVKEDDQTVSDEASDETIVATI